MKNKFEKAFDDYLNNYDKNVKEIRYKYHHSYEVEKLMEKLAKKLGLRDEEVYIAKLIGLLHDIGRFEQVRISGKCSDVRSGIDHADQSCIYLFDENHIRDFIDDSKYDKIIKDAIKNHNKYEIDKKVKGKNLLFSKMIRDTDKIDIYRVLSEEYKQFYNKDDLRDYVKEMIDSRKTIKCFKGTTASERGIVHSVLVFDINFKESFEMLKKSKYLDSYFNTYDVEENSKEEFEKFKRIIYDYIEEHI